MAMGFKGMGWFLCGLVVAPGCYVVMSQVAAERARVESVERAIRQAKRDIRDLETEFRTRANLAQLEKWNGEVFALAAPQPEQFAASITALAARGLGEGDAEARYASYVVPTMTAEIDAAVRGGIQAEAAAEKAAREAAAPPVALASAEPAAPVEAPKPKREAKPEAKPAAPVRVAKRTEKRGASRSEVAALDRALLSDATLGDLMQSARSEARSRH